jgi:hypothetical protein
VGVATILLQSHDIGGLGRKPLLLIDVDGVVSLFGFPMDQCPAGTWQWVDGIVHFLSAEAAGHLQDLQADFELVWCSGWEEKCCEYLPAALGVHSSIPYVSFDATPEAGHGHWKLAAITAYVRDRPVAWVDDGIDDACRAWASARTAPTLLIRTDPEVGLVAQHAEALRAWARDLR